MKRVALITAFILASVPAFAFSVDFDMPRLQFPTDTATVLSTSGK